MINRRDFAAGAIASSLFLLAGGGVLAGGKEPLEWMILKEDGYPIRSDYGYLSQEAK